MFVCFLWKNKCALDRGSLFDLLSPWLFFLSSHWHCVLLHLAPLLPSPWAALSSAPRYMDINEACWSCGEQQKQFSLAVNLLYGHFLSLEELWLAHTKAGLKICRGPRRYHLQHSCRFLPSLTQKLRGQSPSSYGA